jgi:hypothetical protein
VAASSQPTGPPPDDKHVCQRIDTTWKHAVTDAADGIPPRALDDVAKLKPTKVRPPKSPPAGPPDAKIPWVWDESIGKWLLIVTDTADGIPPEGFGFPKPN